MAAQHSVARAGAARAAPRAPWFRSSQRILGRDWPIGWLFFVPTGLLLFGLIGYPFLRALYLSLFNVVGVREGAFVGLQNYANLLSDAFFWRAIATTTSFTFFSEVFKFSLGLLAALLLHNLPRWGTVLGGLILLPYIIPEVVRALAWRILLDPLFGALNYILENVLRLGRGPSWLGDPSTALPSVITVNVWAGIPFFVILFLAGLKAIDRELYDAAAVDGANAWRRFLHVTLPGLRNVIIVALLLSTIFTFNSFTLTYLLTGGGPGEATRVYAILAYEYAVQALRYSSGVAVAMTVAPFLFLLILVLGRFMLHRDEAANGQSGSLLWRGLVALAWPVRLLLRGLSATFWFANDIVERAAGLLAAAVRRSGVSATTGRHSRRRAITVVLYALLGVILVFELFPFYFIFVTAFKSTLQIQQIQSMFWPAPWTLDHFIYLFTELPFATWYANAVLVALVSTLVSILAASLGAYALVRLKWRGVSPLSTSVLVAYLMPPALMFIPLYAMLTQLQLINTQAALMVTYPTVVLPFATWLMMGYYRTIPERARGFGDDRRLQSAADVLLRGVAAGAAGPGCGGNVLGHAGMERVPICQDISA